MEAHGIHPAQGRKEITCADCGHRYLIAQGQRGGRCQSCGNIEFIVDENAGGAAIGALSQEIVARLVLPRLQEQSDKDHTSLLERFRSTPEGAEVEALRIRYQVEWQLWAALVKKFEDPAYHMAYICQAAITRELDRAAERYREHRSVMALLRDSQWQAEVADLMLARIEGISAASLGSEGSAKNRLPEWLLLLPLDARIFRVAWITLGLVLAAKVLRFI